MPRRAMDKKKMGDKMGVNLITTIPVPDQSGIGDVPIIGGGFDSIIETIFDNSEIDIGKEYGEIEASFKIKDALTITGLRVAASRGEEIAFRASRLWVMARVEHEAYLRDTTMMISWLKESAKEKLEEMKATGKITKQITENDVVDKVMSMYPDQWNDVQRRKDKAENMLRHLENMVKIARSRPHTLSNMMNPGNGVKL